ncbi:capsule assembly Wzi family protein [Salegentibacter sp. HM20]
MFRIITLCLLFFSFGKISAQGLSYSLDLQATGLVYSEETSPFWMHSNQRGRIDEATNFSGLLSGKIQYALEPETLFEFGAGSLYQDGFTNDLQADELYFAFQKSWFSAVLGRKQRPDLYNGLSATNENIVWSLNARPMNGIRLFTNRPVFFKNNRGIGFKAALEEYITDDERFVEDTRVHHKNFHLVYRAAQLQVSAGLEHFVQWGGVHPEFGQLPASFSEYKNVFFGKEGDDIVGGQEVNALGNHLGSYVINLQTSFRNYDVELIYNHLFEDGSGRVLRNTPDGRYGLYLSDREPGEKLIQNIMYEFYYTKNQSKNFPSDDFIDNYFNNNLYRSGWTYGNKTLGVPFISTRSLNSNYYNNTILVHHLGISGYSGNVPYKLLLSYRKNYGPLLGGEIPPHTVFSTYLELKVYQGILDVNLLIASDFSSLGDSNFGGGIQISRKIF